MQLSVEGVACMGHDRNTEKKGKMESTQFLMFQNLVKERIIAAQVSEKKGQCMQDLK